MKIHGKKLFIVVEKYLVEKFAFSNFYYSFINFNN